uniref:SDH assembly factor 2 n=1 Tax=Ditylenchus dipsaci TaxID=166011 RepID=A0A915CXD2_9BILA
MLNFCCFLPYGSFLNKFIVANHLLPQYISEQKRGILENDIIIGGFAAKHLNELSSSELNSYDKIINNNDHMEWDLYYYFVGRKDAPPELKDCPVFKRMCVFACSKKAAIDK